MKTLSMNQMSDISAGGCGWQWAGLGIAYAGLFVAGAVSGGFGWAVGGYMLAIADLGICAM